MYSVMIVDDEPLMRKYLRENLSRIAPMWAVCGEAEDGMQAVELLQTRRFDLVLTDIRMPEMDGLELANYIYQTLPDVRVAIISGFDEFDYARRALRCGVVDYLLKPLSDKSIVDTLETVAKNIETVPPPKPVTSQSESISTGTLPERACAYIKAHYSEPISLALVADLLSVTPSYLSDLFHKSVGESYSKYVMRIRMEEAIRILCANPREKIYDLAQKAGFISPKHFHSVFKKFYGVTPSEYMQSRIDKSAP